MSDTNWIGERWREKYYDKILELRLAEDKLIIAIKALDEILDMAPNNSNVILASLVAEKALMEINKNAHP